MPKPAVDQFRGFTGLVTTFRSSQVPLSGTFARLSVSQNSRLAVQGLQIGGTSLALGNPDQTVAGDNRALRGLQHVAEADQF